MQNQYKLYNFSPKHYICTKHPQNLKDESPFSTSPPFGAAALGSILLIEVALNQRLAAPTES